MADPPPLENLASRRTPRNISKSKRALGEDYPKTLTGVQEEVGESSSVQNKRQRRDNYEAPLHPPLPQTTPPDEHPDGCALRADGTHKDASEIPFYNDPDDEFPIGYTASSGDFNRDDNYSNGEGIPNEEEEEDYNESGDNDESHSDVDSEGHESRESQVQEILARRKKGKGKKKRKGKGKGKDKDEEDHASTDSGDDEGTTRYHNIINDASTNLRAHATADIQLFYEEGKQGGKTGYFCSLCLANNKPKVDAFFTGNVTSRRAHLSRNHYEDYLAGCNKKKIEAKAKPPKGYKPPQDASSNKMVQKSIKGFTVKYISPPPLSKTLIKELLLELMADADLPFRFCERPAFRRFVLALNPKLTDKHIPKKTSMADSVKAKVERLDKLDVERIAKIDSRITLIGDGWSAKSRRPYTGIGIQYISSDKSNEAIWNLESSLLVFESSAGRHTGKAIGRELVRTVRTFNFESKFGFFVGDNLQSNDVGVRYMVKKFNANITSEEDKLIASEVRGRCISHTMHLGPCHFIKALGVAGLMSTKKRVHQKQSPASDKDDSDDDELSPEEEYDEDLDVDTSPLIEADAGDPDALLATLVVEFDPGDTLGKALAFVNQLRACSTTVLDFFEQICATFKIVFKKPKLWVRTRWGSLADCFAWLLLMQKVINHFTSLADDNEDLPKLRNGKKWRNFKMTGDEWNIITLAYNVLAIPAKMHAQLASQSQPTLQHVYPLLEKLMSDWDDMINDPKYAPIKHAIQAGVDNMVKWYRKTDESSIYFIAHVLDPVIKLRYVKSAWESDYVEAGMEKMKEQFLKYKRRYDALQSEKNECPPSSPLPNPPSYSESDNWMEAIIANSQADINVSVYSQPTIEDELEEFYRYFNKPGVSRADCKDPIKWWGLHGQEFVILRRMAKDYLAIPAASVLIERAFSMSALTDVPRRGNLLPETFGGLQRLRDAYRQGRLKAVTEAWLAVDPSFDPDVSDASVEIVE
ncbi:hypothetical protein CVT24_002051 [Panaeolus cyanescens]|uniref:HAT C-terminal dimerisation domain-containing protein n=1 Tax=Panaeolus cyanescens TaxID=181874 RepID=A0A409YH97_9AGAR|nr:hypothetical protein CVT24_002051 [Panaeolus cyanescens]